LQGEVDELDLDLCGRRPIMVRLWPRHDACRASSLLLVAAPVLRSSRPPFTKKCMERD
jgi:hypothetical protein